MELKELKTRKDMEALEIKDWVACEWHRDIRDWHGNNKRRRSVHEIHSFTETGEVILDGKANIYFNVDMFLGESSNLKAICKIII